MPITDLNSVHMGNLFTGVTTASENTTDLWLANPSTIAWVLIVAVVFGLFGLLFFFLTGLGKKALKR